MLKKINCILTVIKLFNCVILYNNTVQDENARWKLMKFLLNKTLIFTVISEKVYGVFAFVFFFLVTNDNSGRTLHLFLKTLWFSFKKLILVTRYSPQTTVSLPRFCVYSYFSGRNVNLKLCERLMLLDDQYQKCMLNFFSM